MTILHEFDDTNSNSEYEFDDGGSYSVLRRMGWKRMYGLSQFTDPVMKLKLTQILLSRKVLSLLRVTVVSQYCSIH